MFHYAVCGQRRRVVYLSYGVAVSHESGEEPLESMEDDKLTERLSCLALFTDLTPLIISVGSSH